MLIICTLLYKKLDYIEMSFKIKKEKKVAHCASNPDYDKALLYLATFSNGRPEINNFERVQFTSYEDVRPDKQEGKLSSNKRSKILVADAGRLQYCGYTKSLCLDTVTSNYQFLVGVVDKKTDKFKIYKTEVVNCKPILSESKESSKEFEDKSYIEKVDALTKNFGTKRKRQAVESRMKHAVKGSNNVGSINSAIEDAAIQMKEQDKIVEQKPKPNTTTAIPPQNNAAKSVECVYNLNDIINEMEYKELSDASEIFCNATLPEVRQWKTDARYGEFVCNFLNVHYGNMSVHKAKLLLYFHYMTLISKLGYKDLRKKDIVPEIPMAIREHILSKYIITTTDDKGRISRSMPPKMKDKILAYSMVLALILSSFNLNASWLQRDYKASTQKLSKIAYALGCHISSRKSGDVPVKFIELKLPLYFPSDKPFLRRKGKN